MTIAFWHADAALVARIQREIEDRRKSGCGPRACTAVQIVRDALHAYLQPEETDDAEA